LRSRRTTNKHTKFNRRSLSSKDNNLKNGTFPKSIKSKIYCSSCIQSRRMNLTSCARELKAATNNKRNNEHCNLKSIRFFNMRLLQKYQNFMKELENQHHQEITRFDKSIKMQCNKLSYLANTSMNVSRMSNMSRALNSKN
jgi:predicted amidophosphoribosyltransferase